MRCYCGEEVDVVHALCKHEVASAAMMKHDAKYAAFGEAAAAILREHPRGSGAHSFSWGRLVEAADKFGIQLEAKGDA